MAIPTTVASLEAEVASECAAALAEAGVYLRAVDGQGDPYTPAIRIGLRKGLKDVGIAAADPQVLVDADLVNLSAWATERVLEWGKLHALRVTLMHWHRAVARFDDRPLEPAPMQGGWLAEEKRAVREAVAALEKCVAEPFREPADPIVVASPAADARDNAYGLGRGWCGWP